MNCLSVVGLARTVVGLARTVVGLAGTVVGLARALIGGCVWHVYSSVYVYLRYNLA